MKDLLEKRKLFKQKEELIGSLIEIKIKSESEAYTMKEIAEIAEHAINKANKKPLNENKGE